MLFAYFGCRVALRNVAHYGVFISLLNGCFTKSYSDFDGIVTNAAIQPDNKATERI